MMQYNTVGKTGIRLSVVGFGTAQLRMLPERQAIDTLLRGFELGVNWVHTATDYGGAEGIIAKAVAESGRRDIQVVSNAPGPIENYRRSFENTCRLLGTNRLPLYGISGIDYCEDIGHNVWGSGGLLEFLQQMKRENRLGGIYCSTHGSPEYISGLIMSGCFDALMLSYNPLGFHVLSYYGAAEGKEYEEIDKHLEQIFPLARQQGVSLLIMKPLAGGLLCRSKAFPSRDRFSNETEELRAGDVLRAILRHQAVCAVAPGTASVEEAEENALAGYAPPDMSPQRLEMVERAVTQMRAGLCSRCGICESTCSRSLRISWLFREGYIWNYPADTFEALGRLHYFKLHPDEELVCSTCTQRTCVCPSGLDIPASLARVHKRMLALRAEKLIHATPEELETSVIQGHLPSRIICSEIPRKLQSGRRGLCRLWLENVSGRHWPSFQMQPRAKSSVALVVALDKRRILRLPLAHDMVPGERTHFVFELPETLRPGRHTLSLSLMTLTRWNRLRDSTHLLTETIEVEGNSSGTTASIWKQIWEPVLSKFTGNMFGKKER